MKLPTIFPSSVVNLCIILYVFLAFHKIFIAFFVFSYVDTIKLIYVDEDIFVAYECFSNKFDSHRYCHRDFEHLQVSHRRRHINTVELRRIVDIVTKKTCFSQSELVMANHTSRSYSLLAIIIIIS